MITRLRACLKSRMRGHVIVGVMTISTDVDKLYDTDLTDAAWALIAPMLPAARPGGRPRKINIRAVLNAIFYLLRTGPSSGRTVRLSIGGDHGWPIGQDDRAWWCSWFRCVQAREGTQTPHLGRHTGPTGCQPCRTG